MGDSSDQGLQELRDNISWFPVAYSGSSFRSHSLHSSSHGLRYWPEIKSFVIPSILVPFAVLAFLTMYSQRDGSPDAPSFFAYLWPIGMLGVFIYRLYVLLNEVNEFNFGRRFYYRGLKTKKGLANSDNYVSFDDILAVQLLGEYVKTGSEFSSVEEDKEKRNFTSYELNLVLKVDLRMNVVDYGSLDKIKLEAEIIAKHLDVPLLVQHNIERI